jgi:hypothetical protein
LHGALEEGGDVVLQLVTGLFVIVHHMTAEIATGVTLRPNSEG